MVSAARHAEVALKSEESSVPDAPIEAGLLYRPRTKGSARHFGFLPFFAKKPWSIVQQYIEHFSRPGDLVCDPFAGSGVAPVEALVLGRRAVAGDINPVARFLTEMTAISPIDLDGLRAAYGQVQRDAQERIESLDDLGEEGLDAILATLDYPRDPIPDSVRRAGADTVDDLHTPRQLAGLTFLREAIQRVMDPVSRDLLRVALVATVRYCNRTYWLPSDKGTRRSPYRGDAQFLRRFSYSLAPEERFYELPVWPTFERRFAGVLKAKKETNALIGDRYTPASFRVTDVPASRIHEVIGENQVDYVFTDPPYSNEIHFLDLSTLWAAWLGTKITEATRREELLLRDKRQVARQEFARQFSETAESIARALKQDHWLTLVYKHRDINLWQTVVNSCEENGLLFVNAVWQDLRIRSTRQVESPHINPKGDMYLNFRKMARPQFERIYGSGSPVPLPTPANYVHHEVERQVVGHLGADIQQIASGVIGRLLSSRAFRDLGSDPTRLTDDIAHVLQGRHFTEWRPEGSNKSLWIVAPGVPLDTSLDPTDRARYHVFEFLRQHGEAEEGQIREYLLTRWAEEGGGETGPKDIDELLRNVAVEVRPHRWRLDFERLLGFRQLRLIWEPSEADRLRAAVERRKSSTDENPLRPDLEGVALLRDRLARANEDNPDFDARYQRLASVLQSAMRRISQRFAQDTDRVLAVGDWAIHGIDLRNLPFEEVLLHVVVRESEPSFDLYSRFAREVFADLDDRDVLLQFRLESVDEWRRAEAIAHERGEMAALGIPLLVRK